ncbi:Hypothetical protein FKW44_024026 [Caligus rogercresseyi]|uniref:Uncharacterized protein n=1 Tax=Caligus rogercresseyi TaxID=217165 RepID=A0A7T8JVJ5_CALRO|nr:Hypothetical protein FKW44_024026 [Caligus rogercresseyi]
MSKRKEHKPRSDRICTLTFVAGLRGPSRPIRDHPCPSSPGSVLKTVVVP